MSQTQVTQFIEEATQEMQGGRTKKALEVLGRALALDPKNGEAHGLRGVALSTLGQNQEATEAFRLACSNAPSSAKIAINFATHLNGTGDKEAALAEARRATSLQPGNDGAVGLMRELEAELGEPPLELGTEADEVPLEQIEATGGPIENPAPYVRTGYYDDLHEIQSLRWVEAMGSAWYILGWVLSVIDGLFFIRGITEFVRNLNRGQLLAYRGDMTMLQTTMSAAAQMVSLACILGIILWFIFEIVNRRGPWLWLLPALLACSCSFTWAVVVCYLIFDRPRSIPAA